MSIQSLIFILYQVVVIAAIIHVLMDNRQPAKTMAWAMVIYFVPLVGIIAYIFFGANTRKQRLVGRRSMDKLTKRSMLEFVEQRGLQLPAEHQPLINLFVNESFSLPFSHNKVETLTDGYQFFHRLLCDIASAESHIHLDVYIFEDDALGRLISDALVDKARKGVEVRIIYDDVGCWGVRNHFFERMRKEGIEVEPFMPVRFPSFARRANYRNHRKLYVIDGRVGYIGGMNIAQRYVQGIPLRKNERERKRRMPWRDTMMRIEGRGVYSLQRAFLIDWYFVDRTLLSEKKYYPSLSTPCSPQPDTLLQTVTSGPSSLYPEIMQGYVRIIMAAQRYIYIETPYFLPTSDVLSALKTAALTGVNVRVLIPRYSDARFTEWASRSYLREAIAAGVSVSLYEAGFLHSKLMVSDDHVCTCGSTNFDFRSFENNFEANTFIYDTEVSRQLHDIFLNDEKHSIPFHAVPTLLKPSFAARLWESLTRLLSPLL